MLTACKPEIIDGISLKLRDLHTIYSVMLDYTERYISTIEAEHRRCNTAIDLNAPIGLATRRLEDLIRIMLSAHLSSYESIIYYLKEAIGENSTAVDWLEMKRRTTEDLSAFDRLRNTDVHHEPLNTVIGMRYRLISQTPPYSSIDTREVHQHLELRHEGIGFAPWALEKLRQFASHPGLVDFITYESVLQLAHRSIHVIADLISEAVDADYLVYPKHLAACNICKKSNNSPHG